MATLWFQVDQIPDLSLNKYQSLADSGVDGVLKRHEQFLRQWHGICKESRTSIHLLYEFLPDEQVGKRLKLYLLLQGEDSYLNKIRPLLGTSPLSEFYMFRPVSAPLRVFSSGVTLTKREQLAEMPNSPTGKTTFVHYVPKWKMNDGARLYDLMRMMKTVALSYQDSTPCAFRIDVYPVSLIEETRSCFLPIIETLRGENEICLVDDGNSLKQSSYARDICKEHED